MSKIRFSETTEPSTPNTDKGWVYLDTDGKLKLKNDAGIIYDLTASGGAASTDHSTLTNLDFASAGHTGFASSSDLVNVSGHLQTQITTADADVSSLNGLQGAVTLAGAGIAQAFISGQTITISVPPDTAIIGDSFISVVSGSNTVNLLSDAIIGGDGISVVSGSNTITINATGQVSGANAIIGDSFISVVSGSNTTQLLADAIISGNNQITITSGTNTLSIFGAVPPAIIGGTNISVVSGSNTITINSTAGASDQKAIIGDSFISVVTGTSTINILADAVVGLGSVVISSGTNTLTVSGAGPSVLDTYQIFSDQMMTPLSADWAVNAFAPLSTDTNNSALSVRLFDDTTEEGVGWEAVIPANALNMNIKFKSRAETAPGDIRTVGVKLYRRQIPDNSAITAWSGTNLNDISIPANENFQYDQQTISLSSFSINAGTLYQFELTRVNPAAGTELVGDWVLLLTELEFT